MPYGRFTYRVERTRIVPPTETSVIDRVDHDRLVLSACHPLYSAAKRIIVFARLERRRRADAVSGAHPIERIGPPVTTYVHMTVLAVRPSTGTGRRFGRSDESRRTHMEQLRERIELESYAVDPHKVADAIVRRLLTGSGAEPSAPSARSRATARLTDPRATARRAYRLWRARST